MLRFTSMKFHGIWVLDIRWILKVFHLTNDAVNPIWDFWFTFQVASCKYFHQNSVLSFLPTACQTDLPLFNLYFRSRSYTWPKFWRPRFRSRGQITSLMLYSFAGFSCLFLWVLIFCFYTCGLTEGAHRNHFVWDWPNYVARPHTRQICKISSTAFSATTSYDLIRSVSYGNVTLMTVWCESLIAPLSGSYMCSYIVVRPWN